jgi:predicted N-acetyltransferase YhbS
VSEYECVAKEARKEILGEGNEVNTWYLAELAVLPEYQGMGIGKALVKYVTDIVSS